MKTSLYDIATLAGSMETKLETPEIHKSNDYYGFASVLKRYAGMSPDYQIKAAIEHGPLMGKCIWDNDIHAPLPAVFPMSRCREVFLRKKTKKPVLPMGPVIRYAESYLTEEELCAEKQRIGKNLLAFPAHSTHWINVEYDVHTYCRFLEGLGKNFNTITVCLYWKDVLRGIAGIYQSHGFHCVTAGHMFDPLFMQRLKSIIELSTLTTSNEISSVLGYCILLGKPHFFHEVQTAWNASSPDIIKRDTCGGEGARPFFRWVFNLFTELREDITEKQRDVISYYWGLQDARTPAEMKLLFQLTEEMHDKRLSHHEDFTKLSVQHAGQDLSFHHESTAVENKRIHNDLLIHNSSAACSPHGRGTPNEAIHDIAVPIESLLSMPKANMQTDRQDSNNKNQLQETDIVVASFPRSGNTWMRLLLADIILQNHGFQTSTKLPIHEDNIIPEIPTADKLDPRIRLPFRLIKTHDIYNPIAKKAVYIFRQPQDSLCSYYHFYRRYPRLQTKAAQGIDVFCMQHLHEWIQHINSYATAKQKSTSDILFISYERLHLDPVRVLMETGKFIGLPVNEQICKRAVDNHAFEKERKTETLNSEYHEFFFRKGKVGSGREELQEDTFKRIEAKASRSYQNALSLQSAEFQTVKTENILNKNELVLTAGDSLEQLKVSDACSKTNRKLLNLGCGSRYHPDWVNVDVRSSGNGVIVHDLKKPLPFDDGFCDAVYHSHVLEHFSKNHAPVFLRECYRMLKPGGVIRVAVPDLEQITRLYLANYEAALNGDEQAQQRYEWIVLELLDQMVRNSTGGEMLQYWQRPEMPAEDFVVERMGAEVRGVLKRIRGENKPSYKDNASEPADRAKVSPERIGNFRLSGEVHQWMYDRYSLGKLLRDAGFEDVRVCRADESQIPDFNSCLLDIETDGSVRKPDSLFMEARKPLPAAKKEPGDQQILRTAIISTSDSGGAGKAAYRLQAGLEAAGVCSSMHVASKKSPNENVHVIPGIDCTGSPLYKKRNEMLSSRCPKRPQGLEIFTLAQSDVRLDTVQNIMNADIVHLHWVADLLDYHHAAEVLQGKKIVWTLHDMNPFTGGCHYANGCRKYMQRCGDCPQLASGSEDDLSREGWSRKHEAYTNLDITVVTPSRWLGACARESALLGRFPVHVIPYGFPVDIFKPYPKNVARAALNIDTSAKVVLFGADIINKERKGFSYLLKALESLAQELRFANIALAFFGRVPEAFKLSLPYPTVALGEVSDESRLAMIYSSADVFVLPTLEDNLPNTVMEAMACGTPVVGFNVGGVPDMIEHMKTGYLAVPRDVASLAEGIAWVIRNPDYGNLTRNCRQKALSFSLEKQASSYQRLYEQLLAKNRNGTRCISAQEEPAGAAADNDSLADLCKTGEELFGQGRTSDAVQVFKKALEIDGSYAPAHNNIGVVLWQMGSRQKAEEHLQKAFALNPYDSDTVYNLGEIMISLCKAEKAREVYSAYLKHHPEDERIQAAFEKLNKKYSEEEHARSDAGAALNHAQPCRSAGKQLFVYIDPGFTHDIGHYSQMAAPLRTHARKSSVEMLHYVGKGVPDDICRQHALTPLFTYSAYIQPQEKELTKILEDFEAGLTAVKNRLAAEYQGHSIRVYMYTGHPAHLPVFAKVFGSVEHMNLEVFCNLFHIDRDFCSGTHNIYYEYYLRHIKQEFDRYNKNGIVHITNESQLSASKYEPYLGQQIIVDAQPILEVPEKAACSQTAARDKVVLAYVGFPHERVGYPLVFHAYEALLQSELAERVLFKVKHVKKHFNSETLKMYEAFTAKTKNIIHETAFLPAAAYDRFLNECDIVLIPYSKKQYPVNTSGMLVDALLRKKVVVVPKDTWMAEQIQRYGAGVTFESDNEQSFIEAILQAVVEIPALVKQTGRQYEEFAKRHSVKTFFSQIGVHQADAAEKTADICQEHAAGGNGICPACHSRANVFVRTLIGQRSRKELSLYKCLDCQSLHNPSGYREDDAALRADTDFHVSVYERNKGFSEALINKLKQLMPQAQTLLDVGAGIGSLMQVAIRYGLACQGVEPNRYAVEYARRNFSLPILCDYYRRALFAAPFDIITIISVLEHLADPASLFAEAVNNISDNGIIFVSVPFYHPQKHEHYLQNPDAQGTLFFDNDVHINHFTVAGIKKMAEKFKPKSITHVSAGWSGLAIQFSKANLDSFQVAAQTNGSVSFLSPSINN